MSDQNDERNPVEVLADEFLERYRRGERPSLSEYTDRHPELADAIRELFPLILDMEGAMSDPKSGASSSAVVDGDLPIQSLGDYRIIREVGRGGMGVVYEAEQVSLGRRVALKVLPPHLLSDEKHRRRFDREARAAAQLHHTNIVPVFGIGEADGYQYYVMQFIPGLGLNDVLVELRKMQNTTAVATQDEAKVPAGQTREQFVNTSQPASAAEHVALTLMQGQFDRTVIFQEFDGADSSAGDTPVKVHESSQTPLQDTAEGRLSDTHRGFSDILLPGQSGGTGQSSSRAVYWQSVARIGVQVANALQYAHHQGVIHRDVKPANLLLDTSGTVWVSDFGLAKATEHQDLTQTGDVLGTLRYMSPEQLNGQADHRSDVYSLGLTLYEMLAMRPAYDEKHRNRLIKQITSEAPPRLRTLIPHIPRDLETIVEKAIEREPNLRYQTAGELEDDLRRYLGDEPIHARRISPAARLARWCRRNPALAAASTLILMLLMTVAAVSTIGYQRTRAALGQSEASEARANRNLEQAELNARLADEKTQEAEANLQLAKANATRAEANFVTARDAVDTMYLRAADELRGVPKMDVLRSEILEEALAFYQGFLDQKSDDPGVMLEAARTERRVGDILSELGHWDRSLESYQRSAESLKQLHGQFPDDTTYQDELAASHLRAGEAATNLLRVDEAVASFEQSIELWKKLNREHPSQPVYLDGLATAYQRLGDVRENLSYYKGWGMRNRGTQLRAQLEKEFPDYESPDRIRSLSVKLDFPTDDSLPHDVDELRRMESGLKEQLALVEKSVRDHPAMPIHQRHLNASLRRLGLVLSAQKRYEEKEPYARKRVANGRGLVERFPQVPGLRKDLAWPLYNYAWLLRDLGRNGEAEQHFEEAIAIMDELVKQHPESSRWMIHLAGMLQHVPVKRLQDQNRVVTILQRAMDVHQEGYGDLGLAFAMAERYEDAQKWIDESPNHNISAIELVPTQVILLWHAGKQEEARTLLDRTIQQLFSTPNRYWHREDFLYTVRKIATMVGLDVPQLNVGATDGAEATDAALDADATGNPRSSIEELTSQIEENSNVPETWLKRGRAYRERGQLEQALADFTKGIELLPDTDGKGWPLGDQASLLVRMGQWDTAQKTYADAFPRLAKGVALDHNGHYNFYRSVILCAYLQKPEEHHRIARDMWGYYREATTPEVVERVAKATLLMPETIDPVEVREALHRLEENARKYDYLATWYPMAQGMAEYRSGRYVEAIRRLESSRAASRGHSLIDSVCHFYEGMAQHQLGRALAARSAYDAGFDIFTSKVPKVDGSQLPEDWHDVLVCHVAQREAKALLKAQDTDEYLAKATTQLEEQRKLVQEAPDDLALQAQLGACLRTTGYLHQRRGEQPLAGEHYQEAFELFKANVAHLKDSASENLSVGQLHTALVELRASGLEVAPEEWESLLTVVIETYTGEPESDSENQPSDAEVALVNGAFDQVMRIQRQRGDVAAGIASLKAAMAYADARLSEQPAHQPYKARRTELRRILTRELPRIAAQLLKSGNSDQAKYIYQEMTKSFLADDGTWDANLLNESSWYVALEQEQPVDAYAQALAWAEHAAEANPESGFILNTLGVAQYRAGHFKEALETLERSAKLNSKASGALNPSDVAFLAMAHHQLGHADEARNHLETLRDLLTWDQWKQDTDNQKFLQEAEELVPAADSIDEESDE